MQRFIVERTGQQPATRHTGAYVSHARTFSSGGSMFDVYIAVDGDKFHKFVKASGIPASHVHG